MVLESVEYWRNALEHVRRRNLQTVVRRCFLSGGAWRYTDE